MSFRLVDSGWDNEIDAAVRECMGGARIISPFIKLATAQRLVCFGGVGVAQVITRFDLNGFFARVSDIAALRLLLNSGARIRGVRHLHAKLYVFGEDRAIVTSANLTEAALVRNHEFGFVAEDAAIVAACRRYFDDLWGRAGRDLRRAQLDDWERRISARLLVGGPPVAQPGLGDEGADAGFPEDPPAYSGWSVEARQAFVKFFGEGHNRADRSNRVFDEIERSGCHWACTYPKGKRPRNVRDGALMFMGRLVKRPNDVLIFGRAAGQRHRPGFDDASLEDLERREWKARWPHCVRVDHGEFVAGTLRNGVSLNEMMAALGSDSFASTQRNALAGQGNTNPRGAFRQQAAVELTHQAWEWLDARLERAFMEHGRVPQDALNRLDWPTFGVP